MLVISRKAGESILIGDDIEVVVIESKSGKVKLGINARENIKIFRKEVLDEITAANIQAAAKGKESELDLLGELITKKNEK